ncbi:glycosyltransferase [Methylobacterium soli]|nr:glycosyltransferase [Methylobacterium soli]
MLIVIPSVNGGNLLRRMFPSMRDVLHRVVVLDQGSTDDTLAVCVAFGAEIVQLGAPRTYTQACNAGMSLAKARGCRYLLVANNDVRLVTDVCRQLLREMLRDDNLAIVAPAQVVVDEVARTRTMTYRVEWNLTNVSFLHDREAPDRRTERLEADFCELTFALVRIAAADEVGFLDDAYGFYHEDADFCFRLREAGYASAYVPGAQIEHFTSSTFSGDLAPRRREYLRKNRLLFAEKHLGYGVTHRDHGSKGSTSWEIINRHLHRALRLNGLLDPTKPELIFAHPGTEPFDYLYTAWETTRLPQGWAEQARRYKHVMTASRWVKAIFEAEGVLDVTWVPHGVETDVFTPWGLRDRPFEGTTFLWFARNQHRKGLDVLRTAWNELRRRRPEAQLIVLGHDVLDAFGLRAEAVQAGHLLMARVPDANVSVWETVAPLSDAELALIYRSVDFYVSTARAEGFGFSTAEAMACGTVPIFGAYSGSTDLACEGALLFSGQAVPADYRDKGFGDVGSWWEPDAAEVVARLDEACALDAADYAVRAHACRNHITAGFTWRHTAFALRASLKRFQHPREVVPAGIAARQADADNAVVAFASNLEVPDRQGRPSGFAERIAIGRKRARLRLLKDFAEFDETYYNKHNPDVALDGQDALEHYVRSGWKESFRRPSEHFDTRQYLAANARVRQVLLRGERMLGGATKPARPDRTPMKDGVLFIGYVEASLGLGESLRNLISAVAREPFPFAIYPYNVLVEDRFSGQFMPEHYDLERRYRVNVFEAAADQLPAFYEHFGPRLEGSYNILRTYWELAGTPKHWGRLLQRMHEIWAPTTFVAEAFRKIYDGPITIVPPCVSVEATEHHNRNYFGMDRSRFYFLFTFDYNSWSTRKNPAAVLNAFADAFPGSENVGLVIKSTGAPEHSPRTRALVAEAAARDPRIRVIDETLARAELISLIRQSDCYVSLHRAEGFGLGMAEALALGKAVVATDYSGNTDFLTEETGFPVPHTLRPLLDGEYAFTDHQVWAEPDVTAAAEILRQVYHEPRLRQTRAAAGRTLIATRFGPENVGRLATSRLRQVLAMLKTASGSNR